MALSVDLRTRIINSYQNEEGSIREIATRFKVGFVTVWRLLKKYRLTGELLAQSPPGRKSKIDEKGMQLIGLSNICSVNSFNHFGAGLLLYI